MKMKRIRRAIYIAVVVALLVTSLSFAQYPGYNWGSSYQLVNMGNANATITITYYDANGGQAKSRSYTDVAPGSSRKVILTRDDPDLVGGNYSLVLSSDQPLGAIANLQLYPPGSQNPMPPFAAYQGSAAGGTTVYIPVAMYNYYGYYTEISLQNAGAASASDIKISYYPTTVNGQVQGATVLNSVVVNSSNQLAAGASITVSQQGMTNLGGAVNRFLGFAVVTADQPVVAAVNEQAPGSYKLMEFNGFTSASTSFLISSHMRNYYTYYNSLTIANPNPTNKACVQITYTPTGSLNVATPSVQPVTVEHVINPLNMLNRYDGPGASDAQSDLDDAVNYTRFFGSVKIVSIVDAGNGCATATPVIAVQNTESTATQDDQAGSINGLAVSEATTKLVSPMVYADFYGYYTSTVVQNSTGVDGSCDFTYTSDGVESSVKNTTKTYNHFLPASGIINIYEGHKGGITNGDINKDPLWVSGGLRLFNGSLVITCTQPVVGYANLEKDQLFRDTMYSFNLFNTTP